MCQISRLAEFCVKEINYTFFSMCLFEVYKSKIFTVIFFSTAIGLEEFFGKYSTRMSWYWKLQKKFLSMCPPTCSSSAGMLCYSRTSFSCRLCFEVFVIHAFNVVFDWTAVDYKPSLVHLLCVEQRWLLAPVEWRAIVRYWKWISHTWRKWYGHVYWLTPKSYSMER